jgi:hypothetical protein
MPTVPRIERPRVAQTNLPTPTSRPMPVGGEQLGRGVQALAQGIEQVDEGFRKAQEQQDMLAAQDAETQFNAARTEVLYNRDTGVLNQRGSNAVSASAPAEAALEERRQKIAEERLKSDRAKQVYLARTGGAMVDVRRQVESHVATEVERAADDSMKLTQKTSLDYLANSYADRPARERAMAEVEGPLRVMAQRRGLDQKTADGMVGEWRGMAAKSMIQAALSKNDVSNAQALFAEYGPTLGADAATIRKTLQSATDDATAERAVMGLTQAARDPETGRLDESKALAGLDLQPESPLKDEMRKRLKERIADGDKAWDATVDNHFKAALSPYVDKGLAAIPPTEKEWLIKNAPDKWKRILDDVDRKDHERKMEGAEARRIQEERNREAERVLMGMPPGVRAELDLDTYFGGMGLDRMGMAQLQVRKQAAKQGEAVGEAAFLDQGRKAAGMAPWFKNKTERANYEASLAIAFGDFYAKKKEAPSREEAQAIIAEQLADQITPHWYGDSTEPAYRAKQRERKEQGGPAKAAAPPKMVPVIRPNGKAGMAPEAGLDAWLAKHPGWRRK